MNLDDIDLNSPEALSQLEQFLNEQKPEELEHLRNILVPADADITTEDLAPLPQAGPQTEAALSPADVVGYGGAAGGGKSFLAILLAMTKHQRTLYIRREAAQLIAVKDEITGMIGSTDGFSGQTQVWNLPNCKTPRQIRFGGVSNPGDEMKYQGAPRDLLVVDEACNVPEGQVRFLMGWVRTTDPSQRCRVLLPSNPPTDLSIGGWYIDYFSPWLDPKHPNPAEDGELRWYITVAGKDQAVPDNTPIVIDGEEYLPQSRTFIRSKVQDNKYLMGTNYVTTLQALPEPLRSQMLKGEFLAGVEDNQWQVIPTAWAQAAMDRWKPRDIKGTMESMGVDPSRGGRDESVIACLYEGDWFDELHAFPGHSIPDGPTLSSEVFRIRRDAAPIHVDAIGIGASVVDHLSDNGCQVVPMTGSEKATGRDLTGTFKFRNRRAEGWWRLREELDPANKSFVALPPDSQLLSDLTAPHYSIMEGNVIKVEPKPDIKKRLSRSPDRGDTIVYAMEKTPKIFGHGRFDKPKVLRSIRG